MIELTTDKYSDIKKFGENFSITSKLSEYILQPDWNSGYTAFIQNDPSNEYAFLWKSVHAIGEELGSKIYSKIYNYIDNIKNIDTCEVTSLRNYAELYGYKDSILYNNVYFPIEISELVDIFSLNKTFLTGSNSLSSFNRILSLTPATKILELSGNDDDYIEYVKQIFYNTLKYFCNLRYKSIESTYPNSENDPAFTIWGTDILKYSEKLFTENIYTDYYIQQQKIKYNIPLSFNQNKIAENILNGQDSLNNYKATEQIIINLELDKLSNSSIVKNKLDKFAYQRENKVLEYLQFISLFSTDKYTGTIYDVDNSKLKIEGPLNGISPIKFDSTYIIDSMFKKDNYYLDENLIILTAEKLVDYCLTISYIRETMKLKAQKYYMAGSNKILVNIIREILFTQLYNLSTKPNYWRYLNNSNNFLDKEIKLLKDFNIETVEYLDPVEYFNVNALSSDNLNLRYWENSQYYINDTLNTSDIVNFYKELGLASNLTNSYSDGLSSEGALSSYWCLSGFLACLFNAGATSATSANYLSSDNSTYEITSNRFILGSNVDGLWYSDNNCQTQTHTNVIDKVYQCFSFGETSDGSRLFIGGTINNGLWYSNDGIAWTQSKVIDKTWNCLYYLNKRFFAGASNAGIWYSDNGIDWFNTSVAGGTWSGITSNGTRLVATSRNTEYGIYYSDDNGINWSKYAEITKTTILSGVSIVDVNHAYSPDYTYEDYVLVNNVGVTSEATISPFIEKGADTTHALSSFIIYNLLDPMYDIKVNDKYRTGVEYKKGTQKSTALTGVVLQSVSTTGIDSRVVPMNFGGIAYGDGKFIAGSYSTGNGIISSTDGIIWNIANETVSGLMYNVTYGTSGFIAGTYDGIYHSYNGSIWNLAQNTAGNTFLNTIYANNLYLAGSNSNTGILSSTNPSSFASTNITGNYWASIGFGTPISYSLSSGFEGTSGTYNIFKKYSGIPGLGDIPYANYKNTTHSSYQLHPYLYAFIQYNKTRSALNYLYSYYTPSKQVSYDILLNRIDQYGNTINFYLNPVIDFSGYNSAYELDSTDNKLIGIDNPFNMEALNEYIIMGTDTQTFSSGLSSFIEKYYPASLGLTDEMIDKITYQLSECYFNIYDLKNYKIYKYCKDLNDNVFILYKKVDDADTIGQLWVRYKNHPIAFPAFVFKYENNDVSIDKTLSQITYSDLITLKNIGTSVKQNTINIDGVNVSILYTTPGTLYIYDIDEQPLDAPKDLVLSGTYNNMSRATGGSLSISGVNIQGQYNYQSLEYSGGSLDLENVSLTGIYAADSIDSTSGFIDITGLEMASSSFITDNTSGMFNINPIGGYIYISNGTNAGRYTLNAARPYYYSGNNFYIDLTKSNLTFSYQSGYSTDFDQITGRIMFTYNADNNIVYYNQSGTSFKTKRYSYSSDTNSYIMGNFKFTQSQKTINLNITAFNTTPVTPSITYNPYYYKFDDIHVPYICNNNIVVGGINEIIYTNDLGSTWNNTNISNLNFTSVCSTSSGLYASTDNGILSSSFDATTWNLKSETSGIYFNDIIYNDGNIIACSTSGLYVLSAPSTVFNRTNITSGNFKKALDTNILTGALPAVDVSVSNNGLYYSTNNGKTWGIKVPGNYKNVIRGAGTVGVVAYSDNTVLSGNMLTFPINYTLSGVYINNLKYINSIYLVTTNNYGVLSSLNLMSYMPISSPYTSGNNSNYYTDITYGNNTYVAVGNNVGINYSTDLTSGFTFAVNTSSVPISTLYLEEVIYDSVIGKFITFNDTYALSSSNGIIWDTI